MAINQDATVGGVIACEDALKDLVTEHGLDAVLQAIANCTRYQVQAPREFVSHKLILESFDDVLLESSGTCLQELLDEALVRNVRKVSLY